MDVKLNTPTIINLFPRHSVNLITGPTNIGKTYYVTQLIQRYSYYFQAPIDRVVIIVCNDRIQPLELSEEVPLSIEYILWSDFTVDQLCENDLVVIDDLQDLSPTLKETISVCAHHFNLAALFVITHSCLLYTSPSPRDRG